MGIYSLSVIFICFGLQCCVVGAKQCGKNWCRADQVCEKNVGTWTCFDRSQGKECSDGTTYCYSPHHCCGLSTCCSKDSECCGSKCCPMGSFCCRTGSNVCCEAGSGHDAADTTCDNGECGTDTSNSVGSYSWGYIILGMAVTISIISGIARRSRRRVILTARRLPAAGGAAVPVPAQSQEHFGYDQPINHANPTTASVPVPPPYTAKSEANVPISQPPPSYTVVVNPQA